MAEEENIASRGRMVEPLSVLSHTQGLLQQLNGQRSIGEFCDVVFEVESQIFKLHRCILAASSPKFHDLIKPEHLSEQDDIKPLKLDVLTEPIILDKISVTGFQGIVDYIYTGQIQLEENNIQAIQEASHFFGMKVIEEACLVYLGGFQTNTITTGTFATDGMDKEVHDVFSAMKKAPRKRTIKSKPRKLHQPEPGDYHLTEAGLSDEEALLADLDGVEEDYLQSGEEIKKASLKRKKRKSSPRKKLASIKMRMPKESKEPNDGMLQEKKKRKLHIDDEEKQCERCGCKFPDKRKYIRHLKMHSRDDGFPCAICDLKFGQKSALGVHIRTVHLQETYYCQYCSFKTQIYKLYTKHVWDEHQDNKPFYCNHPGCTYKAAKLHKLKEHRITHDGVRKYPCTNCGKMFAQEKHVKLHERTCRKLQSFLCDLCGAKFSLQQSMKNHRRLHTMEKPFQCEYCSKTFADRANCRRHRRIHEKSYPYACDYCQQQFRHSNSLKSHLKTSHGIEIAKGVHVQAKIPPKRAGAPMYSSTVSPMFNPNQKPAPPQLPPVVPGMSRSSADSSKDTSLPSMSYSEPSMSFAGERGKEVDTMLSFGEQRLPSGNSTRPNSLQSMSFDDQPNADKNVSGSSHAGTHKDTALMSSDGRNRSVGAGSLTPSMSLDDRTRQESSSSMPPSMAFDSRSLPERVGTLSQAMHCDDQSRSERVGNMSHMGFDDRTSQDRHMSHNLQCDDRNRSDRVPPSGMPAPPNMGAYDERLRAGPPMFPNMPYDERLFNSALLLNLSQYMGSNNC